MASWSVTHLSQVARQAIRSPASSAEQEAPLPRSGDGALDALLSLQGPAPELRAHQSAPPQDIERRFAVQIPEARRQLIGARFAVDGAAAAIAAALKGGGGLSPRVTRALAHADQLLAAAAGSRDVQILQSTGHVREEHLALREAYAGLLRQLAALQLDLLRGAESPSAPAKSWGMARELALGALSAVKSGVALEPEPLHWSPTTKRKQGAVAEVTDVYPYPVRGEEYRDHSERSIGQAFQAHLEAERRETAGDAQGALNAYREAVDYSLAIRDWGSATLNTAVAQIHLADALGRLSSGEEAWAEAEKNYLAAVTLYRASAGHDVEHAADQKSALEHVARALNDRGASEAVERMVASIRG